MLGIGGLKFSSTTIDKSIIRTNQSSHIKTQIISSNDEINYSSKFYVIDYILINN